MKKKITALLAGIFALVITTHAQQAPTVTFTATKSFICPGDTVYFTNTSTFYPLLWTWYFPGGSPGKDTNSLGAGNPHTGVTYKYPGSYYVTCVVRNVSGFDSVTVINCITVKPAPKATIIPPSGGICDIVAGHAADTVYFSLTDTTRGSTYVWTPITNLTCTICPGPGAGNKNPPGVYPKIKTVYTLNITGANGCKTTETDTITVGGITAKITGRDSICAGSLDTLIASGGSVGGKNQSSNNPGSTYSWSNGKTTSSIVVSPNVTTTYSVFIVSGTLPCTSSANFTVNVSPVPHFQLAFSPADSICYPGSAIVAASSVPGYPSYQYVWFGPPYGADTTNTFTFTPATPPNNPYTIYTFTLVTRNLGCYYDSIIKIKVNGPPHVTFTGATDLCQGSSTTLTAYGGTQYHWENGKTTSSINVTGIVSHTYTVEVIRGRCFKDTSFTITVDSMPNVVFKGRDSICTGQSTVIYALNNKGLPGYGYSYLWNTGATDDSIITGPLTGPAQFPYYLTVSKGACSKDSSQIIVKVFPKPNPNLYPSYTDTCEYDSVKLTATGGNYYIWSPKKSSLNHYLFYGDSDKNKAAPPVTTVYSVKVCTWGCCGGDSIGLVPVPIPTATVAIIPSVQGYSVCCNETVTSGTPVNLSATFNPGPYFIEGWTPATGLSCTSCANPTATDNVTTTYVVTFADLNGCSVQDSITIDIFNCNVFVPNVFSPNNDGVNDRLYVRSLCLKTLSFAVFDRWGNKVFETVDQDLGWDGTYKKKDMEIGTYVWYLTALLEDGTHVSKSGNVTLVR